MVNVNLNKMQNANTRKSRTFQYILIGDGIQFKYQVSNTHYMLDQPHLIVCLVLSCFYCILLL